MSGLLSFLSIWTFGLIAAGTMAVFGAGYLVKYGLQVFWDWAKGREQSKEKVGVLVALYFIVGAIPGGYAQALYDAGTLCQKHGYPLFPCTFKVMGNRTEAS